MHFAVQFARLPIHLQFQKTPRVDPEIALKKANAKFAARFREMERMARETRRELVDVPREEMESFWERAKQAEHDRGKSPEGAAR